MPALETAAPFHEVRIHPRTGAVVPLNIGWLSPLLSTDDDWYDPEELTVAVHANFDGRYGVRLSAVPRNGSVVVLDMSNPSSSLELTQTTSTPGIGEFWVAEQGAQSDYGQVNLGFGFIEVHSSMSGVLVEVHYQSVGSVLSNDVINDKILTEVASQLVASTPYDPGLINGLLISNNTTDPTNDIDIAAGYARDATNTVNMILASAITKRLDAAWAVGTGNGGLDTGAIANTTYHLWLIKRSDTGVVDVLFSASASSPTMPANYDYKVYLWPIMRVSGAIRTFTQTGNEFRYNAQVYDINVTNIGTSAVTRTLSFPTGIITRGIMYVIAYPGAGASLYGLITALSQDDEVPSPAKMNFGTNITAYHGAELTITTNTAAQIRTRFDGVAADSKLHMYAVGFVFIRS